MPEQPRFDVEAFYVALDARRRESARDESRRVGWREIGRQLGISSSTFTRIGIHREPPGVAALVKLLVWLGDTDLKPYIREGERHA
jgi:hypothetical protein